MPLEGLEPISQLIALKSATNLSALAALFSEAVIISVSFGLNKQTLFAIDHTACNQYCEKINVFVNAED